MIELGAREVMSCVKGFAAVVAVMVGLSVTSVCASAKEIHWKEQVRLSTGDFIVVERGEILRSVYDGGALRPSWLFEEAWLKAELPGVGETAWQGALSPLVLNVTPRGQWFLLGVVASNRGWRDYGLPARTRYVAFKLQAGIWQRIPFSEFPEALDPNLLANTSRLFLIQDTPSGTTVDFNTKRKVDAEPTLDPVYKRINRLLGE